MSISIFPSLKNQYLPSKISSSSPKEDQLLVKDGLRTSYYQVAKVESLKRSGHMFLNGRVQKLKVSKPVTSEIHNNLALSKKIVDYVHKRIFASSNFPNRENSIPAPQNELDQKLKFVRSAGDIHDILALSETHHIGNCFEMALLGLYCPEIGSKSVEAFEIVNGDHVFLVVGRDRLTDAANPSFWNKDAVICDPWANAYYPARFYMRHLKDYTGFRLNPRLKKKERNSQEVPLIRNFLPALGLRPITYIPESGWKRQVRKFVNHELTGKVFNELFKAFATTCCY